MAKKVKPEAAYDENRGVVVSGGKGIFGHDVDQAGDARRPVNADEALSVSKPLAEAVRLDAAREGEVFDDFHTDGFEATDLQVGFAAYQIEGTDADRVAGGRVLNTFHGRAAQRPKIWKKERSAASSQRWMMVVGARTKWSACWA